MIFELRIGDLGERRLRLVGNTQARFLDHQLVVRSVPDREHILAIEPELVARLDQCLTLG